ncbi:MAG: hypothetical protein ACLUI3_14575 [Christensenellales bacterium]
MTDSMSRGYENKEDAGSGPDDGNTSARGGGRLQTCAWAWSATYAPYNWTQSDASENAVAIAAGGYADGYDVRIAKIIADKLADLEIVKTE